MLVRSTMWCGPEPSGTQIRGEDVVRPGDGREKNCLALDGGGLFCCLGQGPRSPSCRPRVPPGLTGADVLTAAVVAEVLAEEQLGHFGALRRPADDFNAHQQATSVTARVGSVGSIVVLIGWGAVRAGPHSNARGSSKSVGRAV